MRRQAGGGLLAYYLVLLVRAFGALVDASGACPVLGRTRRARKVCKIITLGVGGTLCVCVCFLLYYNADFMAHSVCSGVHFLSGGKGEFIRNFIDVLSS